MILQVRTVGIFCSSPFGGCWSWLELTSFQEAAKWQKMKKKSQPSIPRNLPRSFFGGMVFFEGFLGSLQKDPGPFFARFMSFFLGGGWLKNDQLINVMCWNFGKSMNITYIHPESAWPPYLIGCFMNHRFSIKDFLSSKRNCPNFQGYFKPCWSEANVWICTGIWPLCCLEMWFLWGRIWDSP